MQLTFINEEFWSTDTYMYICHLLLNEQLIQGHLISFFVAIYDMLDYYEGSAIYRATEK